MSWDSERERLAENERPQAPDPQTEPAAPLQELASNVGNRAFGTLARQGAGILPVGRGPPRGPGHDQQHARRRLVRSTPACRTASPARSATSRTSACTPTTRADRLNRSVSARAFATGTDVYFAKGEYSPGSADGDKLIAHELAHTVQQRGAPPGGPLTVSQPGDALEREADSVADAI